MLSFLNDFIDYQEKMRIILYIILKFLLKN